MKPYNQKVEKLRELPKGTLGNDIAKILDENKVKLIPNYESHDLKHVLLNYGMNAEDEIRMQAFMLGNGNYTFPCIAILTFGTILLPGMWSTFYKDYKRGKNAKPISSWSIDKYAEIETNLLRYELSIQNQSKW
ncbi:hypothetical protein Q762_14550 [Flavobacterium cauense R2A-7]|nr:hypothetical protein Q762_14550 [Flavobacterium cauense R2A-7]